MREFFKYLYYLMYVLVVITFALVIVSNDPVAVLYWLVCASVWLVLFIGLMLTRPVEYLYLIAYATGDFRTGRYLKKLSYKLDSSDKLFAMDDHLAKLNDTEKIMIQNIQLIAKTYHE